MINEHDQRIEIKELQAALDWIHRNSNDLKVRVESTTSACCIHAFDKHNKKIEIRLHYSNVKPSITLTEDLYAKIND